MYGCVHSNCMFLRCFNRYGPFPKSAHMLSISGFNSSLYYTGQIRLVGGEYPSEGRLEIYFHDQWGSISSSKYTNYKVEADSACRQLGYTGAVSYTIGTM